MGFSLSLLPQLADDAVQRLMQDSRCDPDHPLESLSWLRKQVDGELARAILTQARLRHKALEKFSAEWASKWLFDDVGLQQASGWSLAQYKAERIVSSFGGGSQAHDSILDLACGIGGDTLALAERGSRVVAVDRDAVRLAILAHNARAMGLLDQIQTRQETITGNFPVQDFAAWHIDPDRRPEAKAGQDRREHDLEHAEPSRAILETLLTRNPHAAVKASPGMDVSRLGWPMEAEWIGECGELKQLVMWLGGLRGNSDVIRRATGLPERWTVFATPQDERTWPAPASQIGSCLYEPDAALIRADLVGLVARRQGLAPVHQKICYLTGPACEEPSLTRFDLLGELPADPQKLARELSARRWRGVEVLCRGVDVNTAQVQVMLNRQADPAAEPVSVVFTRLAMNHNKVAALVGSRAKRVGQASCLSLLNRRPACGVIRIVAKRVY